MTNNEIRALAKQKCISLAETCKLQGDASEAMNAAEKSASSKDQDWGEGATTWVFDDNSRLVVCGDDVRAEEGAID